MLLLVIFLWLYRELQIYVAKDSCVIAELQVLLHSGVVVVLRVCL